MNRIRKNYAIIVLALIPILGFASFTHASSTSNFTQTINAGVLSVDIVNSLYAPVSSPAVSFGAVNESIACQSSSGTFGTSSEQIYVENPDAADNGWTVSLAASSGPTASWTSAGTDMDFNDPTGSTAGCADGGDTDSIAGQLTINPSVGTPTTGQCLSCTTNNISLGSQSAYNEGSVDSITIFNAAAASDDVGDWTMQGITLSQQIPPSQPAAGDYNIDMTLSIVAN